MEIKVRGFEEVEKKFKKREFKAIMPVRMTKYSAGYDFCILEDAIIKPNDSVLFWTDIKAYMLPDEYLKMHIRSSLAIKNSLVLKNQVGIIDMDYYGNPDNDGNIGITLINIGSTEVRLTHGTRVAQGIFQKYLTADSDISSANRVGGFGSTKIK